MGLDLKSSESGSGSGRSSSVKSASSQDEPAPASPRRAEKALKKQMPSLDLHQNAPTVVKEKPKCAPPLTLLLALPSPSSISRLFRNTLLFFFDIPSSASSSQGSLILFLPLWPPPFPIRPSLAVFLLDSFISIIFFTFFIYFFFV